MRLRLASPERLRLAIRSHFSDWPRYWWGVINPWLVFVGPSPGNSGGQSVDWDSELWPALGEPQLHFRNHRDHRGFWDRIRVWTESAYRRAGIFEDVDAAHGSVLLANLIPVREGDSSKIRNADLKAAVPKAVSLLRRLRPRVIVPMTKKIADLLISEYVSQGACVIAGPTSRSVRARTSMYPYYHPSVWRLASAEGAICVAESPQHPSRSSLYYAEDVDEYLAEIMRESLSA